MKLLYTGAFLAVFLAAFEVRSVALPLGLISFTSAELAALFFVGIFFWWAWQSGVSLVPRRLLDFAVLAFLASNFLAVAVAADKAGALKFSLRLTFAVLLYFAISRLPQRLRTWQTVAGAITAALLLVTVIGLLSNFVPWVPWSWLLSPFQEGIITFGSFFNVRVSSTLPFPTVLSIYLELTLPIALVFGLWLGDREPNAERRRWLKRATVVGLALVVAVQIYTFTRSGLVATPFSLLAGAAAAAWFGYGRRVWGTLLLGALLLVAILGLSALLSEKVAARLGLAEQTIQFGAEYQLLGLETPNNFNDQFAAQIKVRNTGKTVWELDGDHNVVLSYRWISYPEGEEQRRVPFLVSYLPREINPGEEVVLDVDFITPSDPGRYIVVFDLIEGDTTWFSAAGVLGLALPLEFDASGVSKSFALEPTGESFGAGKPEETATPRSQLWRAALEMWRDHPLLGVGPDQFRNRYPEYLPDIEPDDRIRTHNIALEALANTGLVGLAALAFLLLAALWTQLRLVMRRSGSPVARLLALGLLVATIAYLTHGLLDYFLWQTGVAFTFFILLGLTSWLAAGDDAADF